MAATINRKWLKMLTRVYLRFFINRETSEALSDKE